MSIDQYECLYSYNQAVHKALLSLDALSRCGGFEQHELNTLAAKLRAVTTIANKYIVGVIAHTEAMFVIAEGSQR